MSSPKETNEPKTVGPRVMTLDQSLFKPNAVELEFLHTIISTDDEELKKRVYDAQEEVYSVFAYPCIFRFHFVSLYMSANTVYPKVIEEGRKGNSILLDLGCCMGTDLRKLVLDGFPATNLLGCDLRQGFIDAGYKLYQDEETCRVNFFTSDIFDLSDTPSTQVPIVPFPEVKSLESLKGRLTYIYTGALFHLFNEDMQYTLACRLLLLLDLTKPSVIFGRHYGLSQASINPNFGRGRGYYAHSPESWPQLWKKILTEFKGESFAANNVSVEAYFEGEQYQYMFWSVTIVP